MSANMTVDAWLDATETNYLDDFVPHGGATVKFAVALGETSPQAILDGIAARATSKGYLTASIDAAAVKVGSIDKVFSTIASQIDLLALTESLLNTFMTADAYKPALAGPEPLAERLARANDLEVDSIKVAARPKIQDLLVVNHELAQDMRVAFAQLLNARLSGGEAMNTAFDTIGSWMRAEPINLKSLRPFLIRSKVNRSNARHLLASLLSVIHMSGAPGLVLTIDISRFLTRERIDGQITYTKAALLDGYEVLREFIDATDDMTHCLTIVSAPLPFLDGNTKGRGLGRYPALYNRIYDEVRDRNLANPLSALVRVGTDLTEVN